MKPIIKIQKCRLLGRLTIGITLYPFIFLKKSYVDTMTPEELKKTINHESIHIKQEAQLLVIFFYLWYGIEYLIKYIKYNYKAYKNLSFEREAYANEGNMDYLKNRKFWAFLKYI